MVSLLRATIGGVVAQDVIAYLNRQFGDSYAKIAQRTGLTESAVSDMASGKACLTSRDLGRIAEGYEIPSAIIVLKAQEAKWTDVSQGMGDAYTHIKAVFLISAELEEQIGRPQGKTYRDWRKFI